MNTRERLVESARDLLWERGYAGTSPRDILERAGAGQGSMYHHFRGKAELALEVLEGNRDAITAAGEATFGGDGAAFDRVSAYLLRERDALRGCRIGRMTEDPQVMADETLRRPVEQTFASLRAGLTTALTEGQRSGEFTPSFTPQRVAATVVATLQGAYVLAKAANSTAPYDDAVHGALELLAAHRTGA